MARTTLQRWLFAATIVLTASACIFGGEDGTADTADATDAVTDGTQENDADDEMNDVDADESPSECGDPPDCSNPACHGESCTLPGPMDDNGKCCESAGECRRDGLWSNNC